MSLHRFFFRKEPVEGIAVFRILLSLVLIQDAIALASGLPDFFGERSFFEYTPPETFAPLNLFFWITPSLAGCKGVLILHLIANVFLLLGFYSRLSAFVAFVTLISLHQANPFLLFGFSFGMRATLFLLIFSRSGDAFSIDHWLARKKGIAFYPPRFQIPWAQRLIQLQTAFIYFSCCYFKFEGTRWAEGTAVYRSSRILRYQGFSIPFLFEHLGALQLLNWGTLLIEVLLYTLVWYRPFRTPILLAGILLHLGMQITMKLGSFEWLMICLLIGMFEPKQVRGLIDTFRRRLGSFRAPPVGHKFELQFPDSSANPSP